MHMCMLCYLLETASRELCRVLGFNVAIHSTYILPLPPGAHPAVADQNLLFTLSAVP